MSLQDRMNDFAFEVVQEDETPPSKKEKTNPDKMTEKFNEIMIDYRSRNKE